jgi:Cu(I)/Ag(I) efflux system periplasmic protein CusF
MLRRIRNLAAALMVAAMPAFAQSETAGHGEGEVRKIDREQGKITLKHGPIAELKMSAMTMIFRVKDPKMLDDVKEGQEVRFAVVRENGAFWLQSLDPK